MKNFIKKILIQIWKPFRPDKGQRFLFIMGHPRSGSSLLMHVLSDHNKIIGFGEYFIKYQNFESLIKSEFDIRRKSRQLFKKCKYIVNQVNHGSVTPNRNVIIPNSNKHIILIRNPQDTISSIINLSNNKNMPMSQETVTSIYMDRLSYLIDFISLLKPSNWFFIDYDELIEKPDEVLNNLSVFLSLNNPLKKEYQLKKYTQKWGDPSSNITKGTIFKTNSKAITIHDDLLDNASKAYKNAYHFFKEKSLNNF